MKWSEGRTKLVGFESKTGRAIRERRARREREKDERNEKAKDATSEEAEVEKESSSIGGKSSDAERGVTTASPRPPSPPTEPIALGGNDGAAEIQTLSK
jgi:hypothetical protein